MFKETSLINNKVRECFKHIEDAEQKALNNDHLEMAKKDVYEKFTKDLENQLRKLKEDFEKKKEGENENLSTLKKEIYDKIFQLEYSLEESNEENKLHKEIENKMYAGLQKLEGEIHEFRKESEKIFEKQSNRIEEEIGHLLAKQETELSQAKLDTSSLLEKLREELACNDHEMMDYIRRLEQNQLSKPNIKEICSDVFDESIVEVKKEIDQRIIALSKIK